MAYHRQLPIASLAGGKGVKSERKLADEMGLSRSGVRSLLGDGTALSLASAAKAADFLERDLYLLASSRELDSRYSTVAVSLSVIHQGEASWKIHFMNLVDEYRRTRDPALLLLPPPTGFPERLRALLASIAVTLAEEDSIDAPAWARRPWFLSRPWFPSNVEALKALAVLQSPTWFRRNNIFVLENFLERA